jgi:hypothetical protein
VSWFQDNPVGAVLGSISAVLVVIALTMAIIWNLPVSTDVTTVADVEEQGSGTVPGEHQLDTLEAFRTVNRRPVFNETRAPDTEEGAEGEETVESVVTVSDAPDVKLTGIIITPSQKIATLTPADKSLETVMVHEGEPMRNVFLGWRVSVVKPRSVILASEDGRTVELNLQVHDVTIKEPPKPVATTASEAVAGNEGKPGEDEQPLSRAEQIRQRIAERREELRREQEQAEAQGNGVDHAASQPAKPSGYQSAIRALMKTNSKDEGSDERKDG